MHAVIFDFDLTLADSSAGIIECINFALTRLGFSHVSPERAKKTIGLSLPETFSVLTGITDKALASGFSSYFVQHADQVMEPLTYLYESVPQTVEALRDLGIRLGIVSTKFRYRIENLLKPHGLSDQFDVIVGGEDVTAPKPDPSGLLQALAHLDTRSSEAIYVGDHIVDAEAAMRAGIPFIAVLSGTCRQRDFRDYSVRAFIDKVDQLMHVPGLAEGTVSADGGEPGDPADSRSPRKP